MPDKKWYNKLFKKKRGEETPGDSQNDGDMVEEATEDSVKKLSRKERRRAKKAGKKLRPLSLRVLIQVLKTLLVRIPILIIVLVLLTGLVLNSYLTAPVVEELARDNFNDMSYGKLELEVKDFNIFRGFEINNILIRNGEEFNHSKFVLIEKLVFRYDFLNIFTGSVQFPEIGIYKPRIYLKQQGENWNFARLMKGAETVKEEEKNVPKPKKEESSEVSQEQQLEVAKVVEEDGDTSGEISLPIAIDFLLNFKLDDLRVYVKGEEFTGEMEGLTFGMNVDIPPFKKIPKSLEAVNIIKDMKVKLNPQKTMNVKYYSRGLSTESELTCLWEVLFEEGEGKIFISRLDFGSRRLPLRLRNRYIAPLNFFVKYDMIYRPKQDSLEIGDFSIAFKGKNLIKMGGTVENLTKNLQIDLAMIESAISLNDLYPYFVTLTGDRKTRFGGLISLYPLTVKGTVDSQRISGAVKMAGVSFQVPGTYARLPKSYINYNVYRNGSYLALNSDIAFNRFFYVLKGSKSGLNTFKLSASIASPDNFKTVNVKGLKMKLINAREGKTAIDMAMNTGIRLSPNLRGEVNITKFTFSQPPLVGMVPPRLKKTIEDIPLRRDVNMKLGTRFNISGGKTGADLNLNVSLPDYGVPDLALKTSVLQNAKAQRVNLKYFQLGSKSKNLKVKANGFVALKKQPISDSNLKFSIELNNRKDKSVLGPWRSKGKMKISGAMKGDLATGTAGGKIYFSGFDIYNKRDMTYIKGLNMNFPFSFDFKTEKGLASQLMATQKMVIESNRYDSKPNFSIKSIRAKHPARNFSYEYMKNFEANLSFKNRVFHIKNLKADIMEGSLYGRSILFNLADFKPANMEFKLILDGTNIDLSLLDNPNPKKKSTSAELSFSSNFSGKGLDIGKELTADGYINIYEIGSQTANTLMKGLSVEQGKSKLGSVGQFAVDNSMIVKDFDFRLKNGLIYTTVNFTRKLLSALITVNNNEVSFDRITVQEYLRNIMKNKEGKK